MGDMSDMGHRFEKSNMLYRIRFSIIDKKKSLLFGLSLNIYSMRLYLLFLSTMQHLEKKYRVSIRRHLSDFGVKYARNVSF